MTIRYEDITGRPDFNDASVIQRISRSADGGIKEESEIRSVYDDQGEYNEHDFIQWDKAGKVTEYDQTVKNKTVFFGDPDKGRYKEEMLTTSYLGGESYSVKQDERTIETNGLGSTSVTRMMQTDDGIVKEGSLVEISKEGLSKTYRAQPGDINHFEWKLQYQDKKPDPIIKLPAI